MDFCARFFKNDRTMVFNTKNQILFSAFKKSYKIEISSNKSKQ